MLYRLSKLIPVPMRTTYTADGQRQHAVWVQWRHHIWRHRITTA